MKPILKVYRGYANESELIISGHIFEPSKAANYEFEKKKLKNGNKKLRILVHEKDFP